MLLDIWIFPIVCYYKHLYTFLLVNVFWSFSVYVHYMGLESL